jgi:uncharacterized membrane protein (DUF106 family)
VQIVQSKIARLNEYMEELQEIFNTLQEQNSKVMVASLKKNEENLTYWKE